MSAPGRSRLLWLLAAGWIDSLCLAFAWTLLLLRIVDQYGLAVAGLSGAAMLCGTALAAPVATHLAARLNGRQVLRLAGTVEAVFRAGVFVLLLSGAPVWTVLVCVVVMNVTAWTGYAGMRAEVAAIAPGPRALTVYCTGVAALEAVGAAAAVLVPSRMLADISLGSLAIVAAYVLALVPTLVVAGGSPIEAPARRSRTRARRVRISSTMVAGTVLMFLGSGPTLLAVALAAQMYGRSAVAPAAIAFTVGSLTAPLLADVVQRRGANGRTTWTLCAVGMVVAWPFAGVSVLALCAAQFASGFAMTSLEGLLDAHVATRAEGSVTGALARVTAGRALGSAGGTAALPVAVAGIGLAATTAALTAVLFATAVGFAVLRLRRPAQARPPAAQPVALG
jgi:hypothetical protein